MTQENMMSLEEQINAIIDKKLKKLSGNLVNNVGHEYAIIAVERGWAFAGRIQKGDNSTTIQNGYNIRRWGTTKGLGELQSNGPLSKTVLDPVESVIVPNAQIILMLPIFDWGKWADA